MDRRKAIQAATGALALAALRAPAIAQGAWPAKDRTVKVIVPWPPGAANDALGRLVAERIRAKWGVTTVVENRAGGAGLVGTRAVIQAEPDGYTLLASAFNTAVMPMVLKAADFNPEVDLECIARTAVAPLVLVMTGSRPQKTLAEVVAAAKAAPAQWNFAISSAGSAGHLATIEFLRRTGATVPMVPYRGTVPALQDIMGGAVQLLIDPTFALLPAAKDPSKARALGIASARRSVLAPDLPTMAEAGLPGFEFQSWYGVWAPKGTPREVQLALNALVQETMRDPEVVKRLTGTLIEPVAEGIEDSRRFIRSEIVRAGELLKSVNFERSLKRMPHAVVTGTSSGIGRAIAERLLRDAWRVTGIDRAPPAIAHAGFRAIAAELDDPESRAAAVEGIDAVDALVHAAGIMRGGRLGELDLPEGERLWRIHVDAAVALADRFAPRMGAGGRIVLLGSRAAKGVANKSQYAATKAALVGLARSWAKELVARGITVNVVAPAATDTAMLNDPARTLVPPETPPMGRRIRPDEIAALVAFLLSGDAAAITGQEIAICGGASL